MEDPTVPLVIDLDGTLTTADTMHRMLLALLARPRLRAEFSEALGEGKAHAKCFLWDRVGLRVDRLPWSNSLIAYAASERRRGRKIWLATGAAQGLAEAVAANVGLFDEVIGTAVPVNLTGERKAERLIGELGQQGFDYAGNAAADLAIWSEARAGLVCNASAQTAARAAEVTRVVAEFDDRRYRGPRGHAAMLRVVGWDRL